MPLHTNKGGTHDPRDYPELTRRVSLPTETMEERFDKKFNCCKDKELTETGNDYCYFCDIKDEVKAFIQSELSLSQNRILGEVEKMRYQQPLLGTPESALRVIEAVNTTVDEVIKLISKKDN